ncbi:hypothetical protein Hanom_Chr01g00092531 [Helianthus anomalus]
MQLISPIYQMIYIYIGYRSPGKILVRISGPKLSVILTKNNIFTIYQKCLAGLCRNKFIPF